MWDGFCRFEVDASPKSQDQLVGVFVDWSVNCTLSGEVPLVGVAVNTATGGVGATTVM